VLGGHVSADVTVSNRDIVGDDQANLLIGTDGADVILGGLGNDTLKGLDGDDKLDGQFGLDTVDYSGVLAGLNGVGLVADMAAFTASGNGIGTDQIYNIENLIGSAFKDTVLGDFNGNRIEGRGGNDRLDGNFGNDSLIGGAGRDTLTGGLGADSFVFSGALVAGNLDRITDFSHAEHDGIVLTRSGPGPFDALDLGALTEAAFHRGATATTTDEHILYVRATGTLYYDADGSGTGFDPIAFAVLSTRPVLAFDDFTVI
jgi:Ca2+-binding RTX toxin-like protein